MGVESKEVIFVYFIKRNGWFLSSFGRDLSTSSGAQRYKLPLVTHLRSRLLSFLPAIIAEASDIHPIRAPYFTLTLCNSHISIHFINVFFIHGFFILRFQWTFFLWPKKTYLFIYSFLNMDVSIHTDDSVYLNTMYRKVSTLFSYSCLV